MGTPVPVTVWVICQAASMASDHILSIRVDLQQVRLRGGAHPAEVVFVLSAMEEELEGVKVLVTAGVASWMTLVPSRDALDSRHVATVRTPDRTVGTSARARARATSLQHGNLFSGSLEACL